MKWLTLILAYTHWSERAVCEASKLGFNYHDWMDEDPVYGKSRQLHMVTHTCCRCGAEFEM